ncbi:MAG: ABC transporter substrate-binding protein [Acidimicrobiia bacterium]
MFRKILPFVLAIAVLVAACSSDSGSTTSTDQPTTTTTVAVTTTAAAPTTTEANTTTSAVVDGGFPVTIEAINGFVTLEERPERIVSISPTSTEVLFAVGAGDQVVAVDDQSNYPADAPMTDLSAFTPNVEAIASYDPDLVLISFDPSDVIASLEAIGIPVVLHPAALTPQEAYEQWVQIGVVTGHTDESLEVVADTSASIAESVSSLPEGTDSLSYYYELDPTLYSLTSSTFVGELIALTLMTNIADPADEEGFGYPQLTAEYIVDASPSMLYLADTKCCGQTAETVAERPGWDAIPAVANGDVVELDDDIASRWGPRIAELVDTVAQSIVGMDQ